MQSHKFHRFMIFIWIFFLFDQNFLQKSHNQTNKAKCLNKLKQTKYQQQESITTTRSVNKQEIETNKDYEQAYAAAAV